MLSYTTYKIIHLLAIISLFLSIGALLTLPENKKKKNIMILHGLATLVLLVSGFGLIARLNLHSFPMWIYIKLAIWLLLAVLVPILISKKLNKKAIYFLVLASGFVSIYMAILKPMF